MFDVTFDFGAGFTGSNYNDLRTFVDTPLSSIVENGTLGGPSSGDNDTQTAPDGNLSLILKLSDILHTFDPQSDYFELLTSTGAPLDSVGNIVLQGIVDTTNSATPPQQPLGGLNAGTMVGTSPNQTNSITYGFADLFSSTFGLSGTQAASGSITSLSDTDGAFTFGFQTRSEGSLFKQIGAAPEPASLSVWALVLACLPVAGGRRKR